MLTPGTCVGCLPPVWWWRALWRPHGQAQLPGLRVGSIPLSSAHCLPPTSIQDTGAGTAWGPGTISPTSMVPGQQPGMGAGTDGVLTGDGLSKLGSRIGPSSPPGLWPAPSCSPWAAAVDEPHKAPWGCTGRLGAMGGESEELWAAGPAQGHAGGARQPRGCRGSSAQTPETLRWDGPKKGTQGSSGRTRGHPSGLGHVHPPGMHSHWTWTCGDMHIPAMHSHRTCTRTLGGQGWVHRVLDTRDCLTQ